MYQRSRKCQQHIAKHAREREGREKAKRDGYHPYYPPELPRLRRVILITIRVLQLPTKLNYIAITALITTTYGLKQYS